MNADFITLVEKSTAHRPIRDYISGCIFDEPALLDNLMQMALNANNPFHYKA